MPVVATSLLPILLLALAIAIAAKPALVSERKLPMTFPLTRRRSFANYNVVESERRRLKSLGRREGNHDSLTQALFDTKALAYYITVAVGSSLCKWLQYLTADEEIPTGSSSTDDLRIDSARWAEQCAAPPLACTAQMLFHSGTTWIGAKRPYEPTGTGLETNYTVVSGLELSSCAIFLLSHWTNSLLII